MLGDADDRPLDGIAGELVRRFGDGATRPHEYPALARFADDLRRGAPLPRIDARLRELSEAGYLRGAIVVAADALSVDPRPELALRIAAELIDALDPAMGVRLARAALATAEVQATLTHPHGTYCAGNLLLGDALLEGGDPAAALRHFEAVLSVDVEHPRALRGWSESVTALERRGLRAEHRSRGLALLDGLDALESDTAFGVDRYELARPLGRGRHAVVYQAYDRRVGRDVAIKRLLDLDPRQIGVAPKLLRARFFSEARTLARVRSPYVVALLDVQPAHRFIALDLCRGGNLRLALRRGLVDAGDLPRVGRQLRYALAAVHAAGAVHRDIKPANILMRTAARGSAIALADFGLAVGNDPRRAGPNAGTLRYLAPELRRQGGRATAASDRFAAGVVLLELCLNPAPLPDAFDRLDGGLDAARFVPPDLPERWSARLRAVLSDDPEARTW
jgi:tRNA A-37 threonylcarbamoyl transferase component Bud32